MSWKNTLLIGISKLFSASKNEVNDPECPRILIVSTTGLGDSLWGTPAVRALKKRFPKSYMALLTSPIGSALYQNNPYLDEIFTLKNPALPSCQKLLSPLKKKAFDTALIFHLSQRPVLPFVTLCKPSQIIGTAGINKGLDKLLTSPLKPSYQHEIERRLKIAEAIGAPPNGNEMEIFLTPDEQRTIEDFLKTASFPVGIHPGAKDRYKQWSPTHFANLGKRLQQEYGAQVFVTGSQEEIPLAQNVADQILGAISVAGKFSVRLTAALIQKFKIFLANDTGPMHLAFAVKTPTFSLFAPTDANLCGPYEIDHARYIQKKPTCFPCIGKKCQVPFCLEQIAELEAWEKIKELIRVYN
ncbi:glycosyltransferase family 9 protein [Simkania sp.]|uniref:glycosyltransferase family 9 protein n=1 Tax=Simkania sp. TaxID=34094 RepID=UPI003B521B1F